MLESPNDETRIPELMTNAQMTNDRMKSRPVNAIEAPDAHRLRIWEEGDRARKF
jgi:hypothetical protein